MDKKEKLIGSIVMVVGCTIFLIVGYLLSKPKAFNNEDMFIQSNNPNNKGKDSVIVDKGSSEKNDDKDYKSKFKKIVVEIKGEVKKPNVYTMDYGSRINDLIKKAGGFTEKADKMSVNCSMKLKDEDCIVIYNKEDNNGNNVKQNGVNNNSSNSSVAAKGDKVNINTASKEELMTLPGVGEITASNIVEYREKNGGFNSVDEITKVNRIGSKTLDKFKDKIEVN